MRIYVVMPMQTPTPDPRQSSASIAASTLWHALLDAWPLAHDTTVHIAYNGSLPPYREFIGDVFSSTGKFHLRTTYTNLASKVAAANARFRHAGGGAADVFCCVDDG